MRVRHAILNASATLVRMLVSMRVSVSTMSMPVVIGVMRVWPQARICYMIVRESPAGMRMRHAGRNAVRGDYHNRQQKPEATMTKGAKHRLVQRDLLTLYRKFSSHKRFGPPVAARN